MKLLSILLFAISLCSAEIHYYSKGKDIIELKNIQDTVEYYIELKGKSKFKNLLFQIKKIDTYNRTVAQREIRLILDNPDFEYYYFLKDGKGRYNFKIFGSNYDTANYTGLCYWTIDSKKDYPGNLLDLNINKKILNYVEKVIGKKVGRGECWDLAQEALDYYSADWKRPTKFGILIDHKKDEVLPGDIIQMYNVRLEYGNRIEYFGLPQHTAIVYKVLSKDHFQLAHQNVAGKRTVILSELNLNYIKTGHLQFYRPIAGFIKK